MRPPAMFLDDLPPVSNAPSPRPECREHWAPVASATSGPFQPLLERLEPVLAPEEVLHQVRRVLAPARNEHGVAILPCGRIVEQPVPLELAEQILRDHQRPEIR